MENNQSNFFGPVLDGDYFDDDNFKKKKPKKGSLKNVPNRKEALKKTSKGWAVTGPGKKRKTIAGKVLKGIGKVAKETAAYSILIPLLPVMRAALKKKGLKPPKKVGDIARLFYNEYVAKKGSTFEPIDFYSIDHANALTTAANSNPYTAIIPPIIAFVKDMVGRKKAGEKLPPALDVIAKGGIATQEKLEEGVKEEVATQMGTKIMSNLPIIGIALAVLLVVLLRK